MCEICSNLTIKIPEHRHQVNTGVTVKMHSPKTVLPSNYLPGNKNSPVFLLLLGVYIY